MKPQKDKAWTSTYTRRMRRFHWIKRAVCAVFGHRAEDIYSLEEDTPFGWRCKRCGASFTRSRGYQEFGK